MPFARKIALDDSIGNDFELADFIATSIIIISSFDYQIFVILNSNSNHCFIYNLNLIIS